MAQTASKQATVAVSGARKRAAPASARRTGTGPASAPAALAATHGNQAVSALLGGGTALPPQVLAEMESRFGQSFSNVRVHNDAPAQASAASLHAKAYTRGHDIVFSANRFAPQTASGKRLLAHELAHVVQQRRGGAQPGLDANAAHEDFARQAADRVAAGATSVSVRGSTGVGIAREPDDDEPKKKAKAPSDKPTSDKTSTEGKKEGAAGNTRKTPKPAAKPRTPNDEFADFNKMLADEFGAKGPLTSDKLLQLYRHGSRATVAKYLKQYLMKQAAATGAMTVGDVSVKVKPGVPLETQVDAFVKNLEGAHSTPQAIGKKLPTDVGKDLPGGKYNPDDALVVLTDKPTHTAMDQPWKDAFDNIRKSGVKEATAQQVFDAVADGIRKTPGMNNSEKNARIARLHDEMFGELRLEPNRKYPIPRIVKWWEILAAKAKKAAGKKAPKPPAKAKPTTPGADKSAKRAAKAAAKPKPAKAAPTAKAPKPPAKAKPATPGADKSAKPAAKAAAKPKPAKAAPTDKAAKPLAKAKPTTPGAGKKPVVKPTAKPESTKVAPAKTSVKATQETALTPAPESVPPAKAPLSAKPTPPAIESSPTPAPKAVPAKPGTPGPKSGEGGGSGALFGIAVQLLAGWIHEKAVEKRIEQQAEEKGWVPYGSPSGEGWLYDLGAWFMDPSNEAEKNVPFEKRFKIAPWRQRIREAANAKKPGETLNFDWQVGICKQDFMGRWKTVTHKAVYLKNADGRWSKVGGEIWGMPMMNDIISEEVPDSQIEKAIYADPCYQSDRDYTKGST